MGEFLKIFEKSLHYPDKLKLYQDGAKGLKERLPTSLLSNFTVQHNLLAFISKTFFVGVDEVWNPFILPRKVDDLDTIDKRVYKAGNPIKKERRLSHERP